MEASGHRCEASVRRYNHSSDNQRLAVAKLAVQTMESHEVQQRVILSQKTVNVLNVRPPQVPQKRKNKEAQQFKIEKLFEGANLSGATVNVNFNFGGDTTSKTLRPGVSPGVNKAGEEEEEEEEAELDSDAELEGLD